jgi:ATP-binding cassette subfamily B protein
VDHRLGRLADRARTAACGDRLSHEAGRRWCRRRIEKRQRLVERATSAGASVLLGGVLLLLEVVRNCINWVRTVQAELLQDHITSLIHEKSVTADLAFYELSDYYDHLHRARAEARYRPVALLGNLGALLQNSITLLAMGAILIPLGPWLALALLLSTLPAFYVVVHYALAEYQWRQRTTSDDRRAWYYDWIMTTAEAAAEIRLFGLGTHFRSNYQGLRQRLRGERLQLMRRQGLAELSASLIALVIIGAALGMDGLASVARLRDTG